MASHRSALALLLVAVVAVAVVSSAPSPGPEPGFMNKIKNLGTKVKKVVSPVVTKVKKVVSPTMDCLSKAGAGNAALGWLKECGQTKFYGTFALASCAATTYAPADVKLLLKDSANCFNKKG